MPLYRSPIPLRPEHAYLHGDVDDPGVGTGHFTFIPGYPTDTPTDLVIGCAYTFTEGMAAMHAADVAAAHHAQMQTEDMATARVKSMHLGSLALAQQTPATLICEIHSLRTLLNQALLQLQLKDISRTNDLTLLADAQRGQEAWKRMYYNEKAMYQKVVTEIHNYKAQVKSLNKQLRLMTRRLREHVHP